MSPRLETSPSQPNQCVLILSQIQDLEVLLNVMAQTNDCSHQSYSHYRIHSQQQYLHHPNHTHTNHVEHINTNSDTEDEDAPELV